MVIKPNQRPAVQEVPPFRIFHGRIIHSKSLKHLEIISEGAIGVHPDGNIAFVDHHPTFTQDWRIRWVPKEFIASAEIVELKRSQFLFPGMIDTHLHAPQWPNLALGMEGTLKEWVENYTNVIASYSGTEKAKRVYADVVKTTLRLGSTTVAYNSSFHVEATNILADTCLEAGQRALVGKMSVTLNSTHGNWDQSAESSLAGSKKCVEHIRSIDPEGRLLHPSIQPRGGRYCPPDLMKALGDQCEEYKASVQAHMCETQWDTDEALKLHPAFKSYSEMYRANGLLNSRSILAHCIHLQPEDIVHMKATHAGIAHNPNSNTCLRDGLCRVRDLLDHGIKVGLGTDCSAGYMPSIHDAMRSASNVSRHLAVETGDERYVLRFDELVWLATMGGAEVVGLENKVGNFEVGKGFDALVVDVEGVVSVNAGLWGEGEGDGEAMVRKWVFLGDDRTIRKVFVGGSLVSGRDVGA